MEHILECRNCHKNWTMNDDQYHLLQTASYEVHDVLREVGVAAEGMRCEGPLAFTDHVANCCSEPCITWV